MALGKTRGSGADDRCRHPGPPSRVRPLTSTGRTWTPGRPARDMGQADACGCTIYRRDVTGAIEGSAIGAQQRPQQDWWMDPSALL